MRVVHLSCSFGESNTGGAAIAATRLHKAMLAVGIDSYFVCVHKMEEGANVVELPTRLSRIMYALLTKTLRCVWKLGRYRRSICMHVVPLFGLSRTLAMIRPDVVHVHHINGDVCSFEQLERLPYKLVFNLHDLYMLDALKAQPRQDRRFITGYDKDNSSSLERWMFNRKFRLIQKKNAVFVCPSLWVRNECKLSIIGHESKLCIIPNLIGSIYKFERCFCKRFDKFIILFGCYGGTKNYYKGWPELTKTLSYICGRLPAGKMEVWVFGEDAPEYDIGSIHIRFLGNILESAKMLRVYHAANVFAFPSVCETQGLTKMEAMACGLPVIAFNRTACAEGIEHKVTGWIAGDGDCKSFADGIMHFYRQYFDEDITVLQKRRELISNITLRNNGRSIVIAKLLDAYGMAEDVTGGHHLI